MSALKIVKDAEGRTIAFGPNEDCYQPGVPDGGSLDYADAAELYQPPPPEPSPLEQIRALEAPYEDDFKKLQRQFLIASLLREACSMPEASGLTEAQVHTALIAQGKGYAKLVQLEEAVIPWRELV